MKNLQPYKTNKARVSEKHEILNRWKDYCKDLYNYETDRNPSVLGCLQTPDEEHHPILREEMETAFKALAMGIQLE